MGVRVGKIYRENIVCEKKEWKSLDTTGSCVVVSHVFMTAHFLPPPPLQTSPSLLLRPTLFFFIFPFLLFFFYVHSCTTRYNILWNSRTIFDEGVGWGMVYISTYILYIYIYRERVILYEVSLNALPLQSRLHTITSICIYRSPPPHRIRRSSGKKK